MLLRPLSLTMANTFRDNFWNYLNSGHKIASAVGRKAAPSGIKGHSERTNWKNMEPQREGMWLLMISLRTRLWGPPCKSQEQLMCRHCQCPDPLIHSKLACFPAASACISLPEDLSGLWNLFCSPLQKARNARELIFSGERLQTTTSGNVRTNTPGQRTNIPLPLSGVDTWGNVLVLALRFPQWDLARGSHKGYLLENETFTELFLHSPTSVSRIASQVN